MKILEHNKNIDLINKMKVEILEHGHAFLGTDWNFNLTHSPYNRLYFVISGKGRVKNEHNDFEITDGYVYLLPINNPYRLSCDNKLEKFYVHFQVQVLPGVDLFDGIKECIKMELEQSVPGRLVKLLGSDSLSDMLEYKGIIHNYISRFMAPYSEYIEQQLSLMEGYSNILEYIKNNCSASLRVSDIVQHFGTSYFCLTKNFKRDIKITLKRYIENSIFQKAQQKLLLTDMSIKEIAYELKFSDEFHFSHFFKKHTGMPPSVYRQRNSALTL